MEACGGKTRESVETERWSAAGRLRWVEGRKDKEEDKACDAPRKGGEGVSNARGQMQGLEWLTLLCGCLFLVQDRRRELCGQGQEAAGEEAADGTEDWLNGQERRDQWRDL